VELTERRGIIPAPYLARAKWIALESQDSLPAAEIAGLLRESYELVLAKLPRKLRETVARGQVVKTNAKAKRGQNKKKKMR
jgi:predicted DNA-binding protein (MmcQ/YjbR family)